MIPNNSNPEGENKHSLAGNQNKIATKIATERERRQ